MFGFGIQHVFSFTNISYAYVHKCKALYLCVYSTLKISVNQYNIFGDVGNMILNIKPVKVHASICYNLKNHKSLLFPRLKDEHCW